MSAAKKSTQAPLPAHTPNIPEAVACIEGAIVDIFDSWSMRSMGGKPSGECLMSALADLRNALDCLAPRTGHLADRGAS